MLLWSFLRFTTVWALIMLIGAVFSISLYFLLATANVNDNVNWSVISVYLSLPLQQIKEKKLGMGEGSFA